MDEFCLANKSEVKDWYDGFTIGYLSDIYNPWSIICFLDKQQLKTYWANTSSNRLVGNLIRAGNRKIKMKFEDLLQGFSIYSEIDEEMVFNQLDGSGESAVWSLLFGRYDVMLRPLNPADDGIILEFKVYHPRKEADLEETVQAALQQIAEKKYEQVLLDQGIKKERIRKYGFAFRGKEILIG